MSEREERADLTGEDGETTEQIIKRMAEEAQQETPAYFMADVGKLARAADEMRKARDFFARRLDIEREATGLEEEGQSDNETLMSFLRVLISEEHLWGTVEGSKLRATIHRVLQERDTFVHRCGALDIRLEGLMSLYTREANDAAEYMCRAEKAEASLEETELEVQRLRHVLGKVHDPEGTGTTLLHLYDDNRGEGQLESLWPDIPRHSERLRKIEHQNGELQKLGHDLEQEIQQMGRMGEGLRHTINGLRFRNTQLLSELAEFRAIKEGAELDRDAAYETRNVVQDQVIALEHSLTEVAAERNAFEMGMQTFQQMLTAVTSSLVAEQRSAAHNRRLMASMAKELMRKSDAVREWRSMATAAGQEALAAESQVRAYQEEADRAIADAGRWAGQLREADNRVLDLERQRNQAQREASDARRELDDLKSVLRPFVRWGVRYWVGQIKKGMGR